MVSALMSTERMECKLTDGACCSTGSLRRPGACVGEGLNSGKISIASLGAGGKQHFHARKTSVGGT